MSEQREKWLLQTVYILAAIAFLADGFAVLRWMLTP
jgi:hypothetical protein